MKKGFTLIELLVVIAIISLLSGIVLASINQSRAKARDTRRLGNARAIITALEMYYQDNGKFPCSKASVGYKFINANLGTYLAGPVSDPVYHYYGSLGDGDGNCGKIALFSFSAESKSTPCPGGKFRTTSYKIWCTIPYPAAPDCPPGSNPPYDADANYPHLTRRDDLNGWTDCLTDLGG